MNVLLLASFVLFTTPLCAKPCKAVKKMIAKPSAAAIKHDGYIDTVKQDKKQRSPLRKKNK
jgi:hypothetical protein